MEPQATQSVCALAGSDLGEGEGLTAVPWGCGLSPAGGAQPGVICAAVLPGRRKERHQSLGKGRAFLMLAGQAADVPL